LNPAGEKRPDKFLHDASLFFSAMAHQWLPKSVVVLSMTIAEVKEEATLRNPYEA
jgi:hypothetical protein